MIESPNRWTWPVVAVATLLVAAFIVLPVHPAHAATGTTIAGMNAAPSARPWLGCFCANPDGWFDPTNGDAHTDADVNLMKDAGVGIVRVEFPWFLIEPSSGTFDWGRVDHIVAAVKNAGLQLHIQVYYPPSWAASGSSTLGASCSDAWDLYTAGVPSGNTYGDFITALIDHVESTNPGGLSVIEIGNEYDGSSYYFNGTVAQYVSSELIPGYDAVKAADPSIRVMLAGLAGAWDQSWFDAVVSAGGGSYFDLISIHDYGSDTVSQYSAARSYLDSNGFSGIPVWVSEFGGQEDSSPLTADSWQQGDFSAVLNSGTSLPVAEWYEIHDDDVYGSATNICQREYYGITLHDQSTLKAGYGAWQSIAGGGPWVSVDDATTGSGSNQLQYSGTWGTTTGSTDGRFAGTSHWSDTTNSTATMTFTGDRVQVFSNLSGGGGKAQISVDGGTVTTVDTYSSVYKTDQQIWDSGALSEGTHTVTVKATGTHSSGSVDSWVDFDRVIVQSATPAIVDDATTGSGENQFQYSGTWGTTAGSGDGRYAGTTHWSDAANSTATITFVGSDAQVRTNLSGGGGIADISVDGGTPSSVDTYSGTYQTDALVWDSGTLSYGTHTVTITATGTNNPSSDNAWIDFDRVQLS